MDNLQQIQEEKLEAVNKLAHHALSHMQDKYRVTFHIASFKEGGFVTQDVRMRVYTQDKDGKRVEAAILAKGHGESFLDNYFGAQVLGEYVSRVQDIVGMVLPGAQVYAKGFMEPYFDERLDAGKGLEDARQIGQGMTGVLFIFAQIGEKGLRKAEADLKSSFERDGITALVKLIGIEPRLLGSVTEDNFDDMLPYYKDGGKGICTGIADFFAGARDTGNIPAEESEVQA
jgi:hypothetical protein